MFFLRRSQASERSRKLRLAVALIARWSSRSYDKRSRFRASSTFLRVKLPVRRGGGRGEDGGFTYIPVKTRSLFSLLLMPARRGALAWIMSSAIQTPLQRGGVYDLFTPPISRGCGSTLLFFRLSRGYVHTYSSFWTDRLLIDSEVCVAYGCCVRGWQPYFRIRLAKLEDWSLLVKIFKFGYLS